MRETVKADPWIPIQGSLRRRNEEDIADRLNEVALLTVRNLAHKCFHVVSILKEGVGGGAEGWIWAGVREGSPGPEWR